MRQVLINHSAGGRRWGLFCISSVCFFLGFFFSWQEVPRAYQQLKEELHSFSRDSSIPPFVPRQCLFERPSSPYTPLGEQNRPTAGPANLPPRHWQQTWTLEIWFLLDTDERREPLVSVCGQILLMSGRLACGRVYWRFTITHFMWFLSEWKYNESFPCFMSQGTWLKLSVLKKRSLLVKSH